MALSLNKPKLDNLAGDIWKSAERLRGKFKPYEYQSVILPIIVIRRLECGLLAWREAKRAEVLAKRPKLSGKDLNKLIKGLETGTAPFSNKTDWTLRKSMKRTIRCWQKTSAPISMVSLRMLTTLLRTSITAPPSLPW